MFWRRRRSEPEASTQQEHQSPAFEPVRIFTPLTVIDGWIPTTDQRLSDLLNVAEALRIATGPDVEGDEFEIAREQILMVAPPPLRASARRQHCVKRPILVLRAHWVVQARVHMIAGIDLDPYLARTARHFLPLTEAWVTSSKLGEIDERHSELLVNVRSTIGQLKLTVVE